MCFSSGRWFPRICRQLPNTPQWKDVETRLFNAMNLESWEDHDTKKTEDKARRKRETLRGGAAEPILRTKKIRLFPTPMQKLILTNWFGAARYTWNKGVDTLKDATRREKKDMRGLRNRIVPKKMLLENEQWLLDTPKDVRVGALQDLATAYKADFTKQDKDPHHHFVIGHRSKKAASQSIVIDKSSIKGSEIYKRYGFGELRLGNMNYGHLKNPTIPVDWGRFTCRIVLQKPNRYYICAPYEVTPIVKEGSSSVAIDPGSRSFGTYYSVRKYGKFGLGATKRLEKLAKRVDEIAELMRFKRPKPINSDKRCRLRKLLYKLRSKIKNSVRELHYKFAHFLVTNFDHILIPEFKTQQLVKRGQRVLSTRTARMLLTLSHYKFRMILIAMARKYGTHVYLCTEYYTTKTCGHCRHRQYVGRAEIYRCLQCNLVVDRDYNAAKNILVRALFHPPKRLC